MKYTLGIDIGTYASKGVLVDSEGRIVASADKPHKMLVPQPGWAEHRPREDWWDDFTFISRKLLATSGVAPTDIRAVACSAIGPCMLPVDAAGEPLMNGVLYGVDARASKEVDELTARIGEDVLLDRCGNALTSQSVGPKILWLKRNRPEIFAKTGKILTSTSFLVHRLTGETVIDHYTAANFSPLYVVDKLDWSTELADDIVGIDKLPRLLWSTEIAGTVTKQAAEETGLAEGTPVTAGTIDAAAEALSVGVLESGDMMMMYGSTIFIITLTDERVRDARLWYAPWLFEGLHASMSGLATSGTLTHWFRERFARELDPDTAFATLAEEAGRIAARRQRAGLPALFLRRADADPRSLRQGRAVRAEPDPQPRRRLPRHTRRHRLWHQPRHRDLCRCRAEPEANPGGRRRHQEPRVVAGDVGHFRARPDPEEQDGRRLLRRRLPGGAGGRRRGAE